MAGVRGGLVRTSEGPPHAEANTVTATASTLAPTRRYATRHPLTAGNGPAAVAAEDGLQILGSSGVTPMMREVVRVGGTWNRAAQPMTLETLTFDAFFLEESERLLRVLS